MSCASSGHITKLKQSIFAPFDIYAVDSVGNYIKQHGMEHEQTLPND